MDTKKSKKATHVIEIKNRHEFLTKLDKGELPICNEPLNYNSGELCHFAAKSGLWENTYQGRSYGGVSPGISFRIAKGVRFRLGANKGASFPMYEFENIDTGRLCITNQRIIFLGVSQTIEIPFSKLITCDVFNEGMILHKHGRKKNQFFQITDVNFAAAILSHLINI